MNRRNALEPTRAHEVIERAWGYIALLAATGVMGFLADVVLKSKGY